MGDLVDGGAYRLHLAHTGADGDALLLNAEKSVCVMRNGLYLYGDGRGAAQRLHENLILLHIAAQIGGKLGQGLSRSLRHVKDGYHLEHGNTDFLFLNDGLAVRIQHRRGGFRVGLDFLDLFLIGRGSDDADTFFTFQDVPAELIAPLVEARHMGGVGALHIDEHGVVDRVAVKAAHGGKVLPVLIALEQLLDAIFDAVNDLPHPVFAGLFFSHDDLLSEKIAPLRRRKHILHRGNSPQIEAVFALADRMTQPLAIRHEKSLAARAFFASICGGSSIVHASVWRPAFGAPAWRRQDNTWHGWRKNRPACRRWCSAFPVFPASHRPAAHGRREVPRFGTSCTAANRKYPVRRRKALHRPARGSCRDRNYSRASE